MIIITKLRLFVFCIIVQCFPFNAAAKEDCKNFSAPPPNDNCENAITLTVNPTLACTTSATVSFIDATTSPQTNPCPVVNTVKDIWYQFVATSTSHFVGLSSFTGGTPQGVVMVFYEGSSCGSMIHKACSFNNAINASGLTIGQTYKIRVFFNEANPVLVNTFAICVVTPPPPVSGASTCLITTINSGFELPDATGVLLINHDYVLGWRTTATDDTMEFWQNGTDGKTAYAGEQFIELNAWQNAAIYQDYPTPNSTVFDYGFAHMGRLGVDTMRLKAGPPGGPFTTVTEKSTGTAWVYYTGSYTVPPGQPITRFLFEAVSSSSGSPSTGNFLDAVTFTSNGDISTPSPLRVACGTNSASISAAGVGVWTAHSNNPAPVTIANPNGNTTLLNGFTAPGSYHFDWTTQNCTSTIEVIFYSILSPIAPSVSNIEYCLNAVAVPLTAQGQSGFTLNWSPSAPDGVSAPTPATNVAGTFIYTVSQTNPQGCTGPTAQIQVKVNPLVAPVTDFTLPSPVCNTSTNILPVPATGFTAGGQFTSDAGLVINALTGEINIAASTLGAHIVSYSVAANPATCLTALSSSRVITIVAFTGIIDTAIIQPNCTTATGSIIINSPTGSGFTYSLDGVNFQSGTTFSNLNPGIYNLRISQASGCTNISPDIVINSQPLTPPATTITAIQPTCATGTGEITVTLPTGLNYEYSIDSGLTYQGGTVFTVNPGTYTVITRNTSGCTSVSSPVIINAQPASPPEAITAIVQPGCLVATGSITVTNPTGGSLEYSINNGTSYQVSPAFTNLTPGNYNVIVRNASGCTSVTPDIVINSQPPTPPATTTLAVQPTCATGTGEITVTLPTGPNYEHSIDNGLTYQGGTTFTVNPGTYTVTTRNTSGCTSVSSPVTINAQPATPGIATTTVVQPGCLIATGSITVTNPTGGGLEYSINNGTSYQVSTTFTNLTPGAYNVIVRNASGCTSVTQDIAINSQPPVPPATTTLAVQPTCATGTGEITVTLPTGPNYEHSIDNGLTYQTGTTFIVNPGTYTITTKNTSGCTSVSSPVTINAQPATPGIATTVVVQPGCLIATGSITVTNPTGGGLEYSINNGTSYQGSTTFANLTPGAYNVIVRNASGCTSVTQDIAINSQPPVPPATTTLAVQPTCATGTGEITVTLPTGPNYEHSIDNGLTYQTGTTFTVNPGTYTVTTKNTSGCTSVSSPVTINAQPVTPSVAVTAVVQPTCLIGVGSITVTNPIGGGLEYSIDNGTNYQGSTTFTNLTPGTYNVIVRNASGCTSVTLDIVINPQPPSPLATTVIAVQPTCVTGTGEITVIQPIDPDFEYSIDNGLTYQSGIVFTVNPGTYTVTTRNVSGCTSVSSPVTINTQPATPGVAITSVVQPSCTNSTGSITITGPLGVDLEYSIDNGLNYQSSTLFDNLTLNTYRITIRNTVGCTSVTPDIIIDGPIAPSIADVTVIQPTCTIATGEIIINSPVSAGLEYSIDGVNFQAGTTFSNLVPNTYTVTVRNPDGCTSVTSAFIINVQPATPAVAFVNAIQPTCTDPTGEISILSPIGAGLMYSINGVDFQSSTTFSNLVPAIYIVTVKDTSGGCTSTSTSITITAAIGAPTVATVNVTQTTCASGVGEIQITAPLSPNLSYGLNGANFGTATTFSNLAPGTYTISVKNASNCSSITQDIIINPQPVTPASAVVSLIQPTCLNATGSIKVTTPTGPGFTYSLDGINFSSSDTFSNLNPGTYTITVRNGDGCTSLQNGIIIDAQPPSPVSATVTIVHPTCTTATGQININSPVGTGLEYSIDNGLNYQSGTAFTVTPVHIR